MGLGGERRIRGTRERRVWSFSLGTASCQMRQRVLPTLISSKAQSERERAEAKRTRGGSANLGRKSEAPENIGHWPIFSFRRREDLLHVKIVPLIQISSSFLFFFFEQPISLSGISLSFFGKCSVPSHLKCLHMKP